jgi:hypothetical protein
VSENDIDVVHLQALQRGLDALYQVLARETTTVGVLVPGTNTKEDFGDDDELVTVVVELLEDATELTLALACKSRA